MNSKTDPPVLVGTVIKAHGLRGEVLLFAHTDVADRFKKGAVVVTSESRSLTVVSARQAENGILVRFDEVSDRNEADALQKKDLFISAAERRPLGDDEYWPDELIGLEVRDGDGTVLGVVADVDDTTPQTRLIVATAAGERLVPLVTELVPEIQQIEGYLVVQAPPGLLELGSSD